MKIINETKSLFKQDPEYVTSYYHRRKLFNPSLEQLIMSYTFGLLEETDFTIGKSMYAISYFLGKADIAGYDVVKANDLLQLSSSDSVAIALLQGDDVLCMNVTTGQLFVLLCETGNDEQIYMTDNVESFLAKLGVK